MIAGLPRPNVNVFCSFQASIVHRVLSRRLRFPFSFVCFVRRPTGHRCYPLFQALYRSFTYPTRWFWANERCHCSFISRFVCLYVILRILCDRIFTSISSKIAYISFCDMLKFSAVLNSHIRFQLFLTHDLTSLFDF